MFRYFRFINQSDSVILVLSLQLLLLAIFLLHMYTICLSNELLSFLASRGAGNWIWPTWAGLSGNPWDDISSDSMDWFKENLTEHLHISREIPWFPEDFP